MTTNQERLTTYKFLSPVLTTQTTCISDFPFDATNISMTNTKERINALYERI